MPYYDIDDPASLVAQGWKAFDLTQGDYSTWRTNLFLAYAEYVNNDSQPFLEMVCYDCSFSYRVSGNLACYIMGNEEFIAWVQNNVAGEVPPIITPLIGEAGEVGGGGSSVDLNDDDENDGEDDASSGINPYSPFTAFFGFSLFGLPLWLVLLILFGIYYKVKKKR